MVVNLGICTYRASPYTGKSLREVAKNIEQYLIYYNCARIHTTLGMTPIQVLQRS